MVQPCYPLICKGLVGGHMQTGTQTGALLPAFEIPVLRHHSGQVTKALWVSASSSVEWVRL